MNFENMNDKRLKLYEDFHDSTSTQYSIITKKNFTYKIILSVLDRYLAEDMKVLDIGCGAGTLAFYCSSKVKSVHGIDISKSAVNMATRSANEMKLKNVTFQQVDFPAENPKGKYDLIIISEVIEHLENDNYALKRLHRLLSKNGIVVLSTPSINAPLYRWGLAKEFDKRVGHVRRYKLSHLIKICKQANFKIIATYKAEGVLRNSLFIFPYLGNLIRFIKWKVVNIVSILDIISLKLFGESQLFVILKKQ